MLGLPAGREKPKLENLRLRKGNNLRKKIHFWEREDEEGGKKVRLFYLFFPLSLRGRKKKKIENSPKRKSQG